MGDEPGEVVLVGFYRKKLKNLQREGSGLAQGFLSSRYFTHSLLQRYYSVITRPLSEKALLWCYTGFI